MLQMLHHIYSYAKAKFLLVFFASFLAIIANNLLILQEQTSTDMSKYVLYLKLQPFVSQFLRQALGDPVVFPPQSIENSTIHTFITRLPPDKDPDVWREGMTAIAIPDSKTKPAEYYNYMTPRGKDAVAECCELLFNRCLWVELGDMSAIGCKTMTAIYAWCENHGVSVYYADTIRQRYYRIRDAYVKRGIDLRKKSRNRHPD